MDNHTTSLCCECCGRTDIVEFNSTYEVVLCLLCREQFRHDIENVIREYRKCRL